MTTVIETTALWVPKKGSADAEWEGAWAVGEGRLSFAVADGASSSYRAGEWASLLVERFASEPPLRFGVAEFAEWVDGVAGDFQDRSEQEAEDDQWYVADASLRGSFATFAGIHFHPTDPDGRWRAIVVGDTCLCHVRDDELLGCAPKERSGDFDSTPDLLMSQAGPAGRGADAAMLVEGSSRTDDVFLLMTDALAAYALAAEERGAPVWRSLIASTSAGFERAVTRLREREAMDDDDVTMLRCRVRAIG